ncbi:MAG: NADH-quinone oxidoreductase subunit L [Phycisphaerae bacterium]|nr:NADH-quinone oxidoreductase subunit L [Phycisphaerae bacterium]
MSDTSLILAIPALPLIAAALIGALGPRVFRGQSHWVAIAALVGSFVAAVTTLAHGHAYSGSLYTWFAAGSLSVDLAWRYDPLTAIMLFTVTLVSLLVVIYSRGYMRGERGYTRFFAYMCLFVFSMCTLVLADNFAVLFLGWEGVGLCSYLLIGYFYERPAAAAAAKKAFIVTRIGDLGLMIGVLLIYATFDTLSISRVLGRVEPYPLGLSLPNHTLSWVSVLLLCGAAGKSGQLLLHVWLPDAMEGPSPVSALIHAATMVTAGVYLVARTQPIFHFGGVLPVVATVGCATAFFAATIAVVQVDIKRILAFSTISQLGYMFLGVGAFNVNAAIFHLFTHAFFKALLFLAAGAVMHAMADVIDLRKMGGLWRKLPLTTGVFLCGCLALAGIPGFAGYFSKDEIIGTIFLQSNPPHPAWLVIGGAAILTAGLTAFYTFRLFMRVFTGPEVLPEETHGHVHPAGVWMSAPMIVLAIGSVVAGWFGSMVHHVLDGDAIGPLSFAWPRYEQPFEVLVAIVTTVLAVGGALLAVILYGPLRNWTLNAGLERTFIYKLLWNKYYFDEIYNLLIVRPLRAVGRLFVRVDDDGIDNALVGVTWAPRGLGLLLQRAQRGSLGGYAFTFVIGAALIGAAIAWVKW